MEQHKGPNTFIFLVEIGDMQAIGINVFIAKKKKALGKIYTTLAHEADLELRKACSNLTMKYLQKQACLETKRNDSNWHPGFRIWVQNFFSP